MRLGDFVALQRGHDLPEQARRLGVVPILGSFGITGYHDTAIAKGPGVTIGRSGASFGVLSYSPVDYWPLNTALYVTDFHGNDERFAYYFLQTLDFAQYNSGSAQPSLNRNFIAPILIDVPEPEEQRAIAAILGTLDDKIDLNRRLNRTLEATARALFRSWFVDFDPVRAKAEGRRPAGMDDATAALFPDRFEASELGDIPAGWSVKPIGEAVEAVGGATPSTENSTFWDGDIAFATPKDMASLTAPVLIETERRITARGLERISSGLLSAGTVLMSSRAPIGYLAITDVPVAINQGFIAMRCTGDLPNYYVIEWARANMDEVMARANGTTFLEISKTNFRPILALVPRPQVLARYGEVVGALFKQIIGNVRQSRTLAALRDALLPKLLSGELRVPEAERLAGRAT